MAAAHKLSVVADSDPPAELPDRPSIRKAADANDRRQLLVALRSRIANDLDHPATHPRDMASLSRRLLEIAKDIEVLDAEGDNEVQTAIETPDEPYTDTD